MRITKNLFLILLLFALASCKNKIEDDELIIPAQMQYDNAMAKFNKGEFKDASTQFEKVFFQHPGNNLTPLAELMQAYSLYRANLYEESTDVLDIFIKLHPRHEYISYAYYLKALCSYVQISEVKLDQAKTEEAYINLREVINRFPGTQYATDLALKIDLVADHLAGHEMLIGRYYLKSKNPIAAITRFQSVIDNYNSTSHTPEALYRLIACNISLGLIDEAKKYYEVINYNYPDNQWCLYSKKLLKL